MFVEKRKELAEHLRALISKATWPDQFKWEIDEGTFKEKVGGILDHIRQERQQLAPTFAFVDPFGATGLPFKVVPAILGYRSCEVLVNLDSDGIGRLATAQNIEKNRDRLDAPDVWAERMRQALSGAWRGYPCPSVIIRGEKIPACPLSSPFRLR